jgi:branched-chain amino acid transport system substrate-binding protein
MKKIGILLPRSSFYAGIGLDLFEGLRAGLQQQGAHDIQVVSVNIGFGAEKQECYRAAEQLLLQENISVVFAYIGHRTAQLLRPLFMAANRLLIVLDAGCNMPQEWPASPNILYHSLHNALGAWLNSGLAARDGYRKAGMASCFYDGGYLHTFAQAKGWERTQNVLAFNHATGYKAEEFSMQPLQNHFQTHPDACLFSLFSAEFAQWFYRDLKHYFPSDSPRVYMSPFGFEELLLSTTIYPGDNIRGTAVWSKELATAENETFKQALIACGKVPNLFSLLGWEAASLAVKAVAVMEETGNNGSNTGKQLKTFTFKGPRGTVYFYGGDIHYTLAPMYEAILEKNESGHCHLRLTGEQTGIEKAFEQLCAEPLENAVSGWYNSYTCI